MSGIEDRYRAVGLRHNPFAAAPARFEPAAFVDRGLADPPPPGSCTLYQVLGDPGYGKSTHLQHWRSQTAGPVHYIPRSPYTSRWAEPPAPNPDRGVLYGDEIDRMPHTVRRRWFRRAAQAHSTLVIGTHRDLANIAQRCGFNEVITQELTRLDRDTLARMIDARLGSAALDGSPTISFSVSEVDTVLQHSAGIPREADVVCHKLLAELVQSPQRVT